MKKEDKIGLVGSGMLGNAAGLHLLESGFSLTVYNRTREKTAELQKNGATVVDSPKRVAELSDFVITCVKDANALRQVSFENNGIVKRKHNDLTVADMSTINPIESRKIASKFKENDIIMLDSPVMGGPNVAINGKLVVMVSGDERAFNKFKNVFEAIGNQVFFLGKNGIAHSVKLAMNLQIAMLALALSEGITLARATAVQPDVFLKILNSTYFKTGMSENKAFKMIKDEFKPTFTLNNLKKDLSTINETAKSFGVKLPMSTMAEEIYKKAIENGFGDLDYTGILAYLKQATKVANLQN
ncbi:MAG TPA: NAD(P)-dependent oxidoreductase [Nitrosopumilaceae archaeon]|nr:NAD(P)-dependent oxidoreductase [Nitrosopumilaceae archaeon]